MIKGLIRIENLIFKAIHKKVEDLAEDKECNEYFGFNFQIGSSKIKFRKAKITPKKTGQFVTLWKRNSENQTEPFTVEDLFDFYIILTEQESESGFFIFPKQVLTDKKILSNNNIEGKRGFRVYPVWVNPENKQAAMTKSWQGKYFINMSDNELGNIEKANVILKSNQSFFNNGFTL